MNTFNLKIALGIVAFLGVLSEIRSYERGKQLIHVCELTGPHDVWMEHPRTAKQELDSICAEVQSEPPPEN